jgi:tRNA-dihydrouridine synthase B
MKKVSYNLFMILKPLKIGSLSFDSPIIQSPLAGISCSAMRRLAWRFGGLAYACTEMLSAHQLAKKIDRSPRYYHIADDEGPVAFQLSGTNPDYLAQATVQAQNYGADIIDLNVGCPMPKIRGKGCGSALLATPDLLRKLILAIKREASCPVTVKIRTDGDSGDNLNAGVLDALLAAQPDAVIVHGRHWTTDYDSTLFYDDIRFFTEHCDFPVIANGNVRCGESAKLLLDKTGAAGVMIARAAIGRPWICKKVERELHGELFTKPTLQKQLDLFLDHLNGLIALENNEYLACIQARRLIRHYLADYGISSEKMASLMQAQKKVDYLSSLCQLL